MSLTVSAIIIMMVWSIRVGEGEVENLGEELKELSELLPDVLDTNMLQLAGGEELRDVDEQQLLDTNMLQLAGGEEDMLQFAAMLVRPVTLTQPYPCPYPDPYPYPNPNPGPNPTPTPHPFPNSTSHPYPYPCP